MHPNQQEYSFRNIVGGIIFASRWLQLPIYIGLILAQIVYTFKFLKTLWHLITNVHIMEETVIMLTILNLIDVVMVANLLIMVIVGGYEIFVSKLNTSGHVDEPEWLKHVNATVLKVKLAMSIISISSIHLLQTFLNADNLSTEKMKWQLLLHLGFLVSAVAMAYTDKILYSTAHKVH